MAREVGDEAFAKRVRPICDSGSTRVTANLWNGEYFYHIPDPKHPEALKIGDGCFVDQVFGQSWSFQVGLGRILPEERTREALKSLWKYNWTPDVGPYRRVYPNGRWYAMPGEGGLIMCTWPKGGRAGVDGKVYAGFAGYFNECMDGFEYQAAGHMIWEGLLTEGVAVSGRCTSATMRTGATRGTRSNAATTTPGRWRATESTSPRAVSISRPEGSSRLRPHLGPDDFRGAFTSAEGWGTITQKPRVRRSDKRWK